MADEEKILDAEFYSSLARKRLSDTFIARNYDLPIKNYLGLIETVLHQNSMKELAWKAAMNPDLYPDLNPEPNGADHVVASVQQQDSPDLNSKNEAVPTPFYIGELKYIRALFVRLNNIETVDELIALKEHLEVDLDFQKILEIKEEDLWIFAFIEWMTQIMRKLAFYFLGMKPASKDNENK